MPSVYFMRGNDLGPLTLSIFLAPLLKGLQASVGGFYQSQKMRCSANNIYKTPPCQPDKKLQQG